MAAATVHELASGRRSACTPLLETLRALGTAEVIGLDVATLTDGLELLRGVQRTLEQALARRADDLDRAMLRETQDEELDTPGLMKLGKRSRSWVEHNGHKVAGCHQPDGPGTRVTWSKREALAWFRGQRRGPC